MITDYAPVRAGIANSLAAVFTDWQVSPYLLSNPTPPCMYVVPDGGDFDQAMGQGLTRCNFIVRAMVSMATEHGAQASLDALCAPSGATSVKAAIEADRTLGGTVSLTNVSTELVAIDFVVRVMG